MNAACSQACGYCGRCTGVVDLTEPRHYPDPCDWCEKLIWPGDVLLANFGGRFCSDECASLYEQDFTAHLAPEEVAALSAEELAALRQRKVS